MKDGWIMVRLRRTTHARLVWVQQLLDEMQEAGHANDVRFHEETGKIPLDAVTVYLLDHFMAYKARPRKKQQAGKRARATRDVSADATDGQRDAME